MSSAKLGVFEIVQLGKIGVRIVLSDAHVRSHAANSCNPATAPQRDLPRHRPNVDLTPSPGGSYSAAMATKLAPANRSIPATAVVTGWSPATGGPSMIFTSSSPSRQVSC